MTQKTIDEMAQILYDEIVEDNLLDDVNVCNFKLTDKDNLCDYHHGLGRQIRNKFKLWQYKWEPEIVDGVDCSEQHPDTISMRVMEKLQNKLKGI